MNKISDTKFIFFMILCAFLFGFFLNMGGRVAIYLWPEPPIQVEETITVKSDVGTVG